MTTAQEYQGAVTARAAVAAARWREVAVATGPADRAAAEAGIRLAYRQAGLAEPEHVVWVGSPLLGAAAALLLTGRAARALPAGEAGDRALDALAQARRALRTAGVTPGPEGAGRSVRDEVRTRPWERARQRVHDRLGPVGWAELWSLTGAELWDGTRGLADRIRTGVVEALTPPPDGDGERSAAEGTAARLALLDAVAGQHDGPWLAAFDAAGTADRQDGTENRRQGGAPAPAGTGTSAGPGAPAAPEGPAGSDGSGRPESLGGLDSSGGPERLGGPDHLGDLGRSDGPGGPEGPGLEALHSLALSGLAAVARAAGWWWPYERVVVVAERPEVLHRDEAGRLDRADGPALLFPDGFALHAWRGMPVPAGFLAGLAGLTPERIRAEENAELRRVMLEHYGYERYLAESGAQPLHRDETGVLWRIELPGDEPVVMVEVVNSTPEPDGTRRTYWLRVPPATTTAREGVAWTFGVDAADYRPERET
jgi:hypothetical protein